MVFSVYVLKRPGVEDFLRCVSRHYELVIYTASLATYASPLIDLLDPKGLAEHRLFREHCCCCDNVFVKDLSRLGRDLRDVVIVDNSPASYSFQPENALPISTWTDDPQDNSLYELLPILELLATVSDVRPILAQIVHDGAVDYVSALKTLNQSEGTQEEAQPGKTLVPLVNSWVGGGEDPVSRVTAETRLRKSESSKRFEQAVQLQLQPQPLREVRLRSPTPKAVTKPIDFVSSTSGLRAPSSSAAKRAPVAIATGVTTPKASTKPRCLPYHELAAKIEAATQKAARAKVAHDSQASRPEGDLLQRLTHVDPKRVSDLRPSNASIKAANKANAAAKVSECQSAAVAPISPSSGIGNGQQTRKETRRHAVPENNGNDNQGESKDAIKTEKKKTRTKHHDNYQMKDKCEDQAPYGLQAEEPEKLRVLDNINGNAYEGRMQTLKAGSNPQTCGPHPPDVPSPKDGKSNATPDAKPEKQNPKDSKHESKADTKKKEKQREIEKLLEKELARQRQKEAEKPQLKDVEHKKEGEKREGRTRQHWQAETQEGKRVRQESPQQRERRETTALKTRGRDESSGPRDGKALEQSAQVVKAQSEKLARLYTNLLSKNKENSAKFSFGLPQQSDAVRNIPHPVKPRPEVRPLLVASAVPEDELRAALNCNSPSHCGSQPVVQSSLPRHADTPTNFLYQCAHKQLFTGTPKARGHPSALARLPENTERIGAPFKEPRPKLDCAPKLRLAFGASLKPHTLGLNALPSAYLAPITTLPAK